MQANWMLCCAIIIGCSACRSAGSEQNIGARTGDNTQPSTEVSPQPSAEAAAIVSDADMDRYFPLSRYGRFPVEARRLLQRADFENDYCRGTFRGPATYRACNRSWEAMVALERLGWCWGNETVGRPSSDDHWLRCSRIRGYHTGWAGTHPPFSEQEISEMTNEAGH
jgi:hypothetical protein